MDVAFDLLISTPAERDLDAGMFDTTPKNRKSTTKKGSHVKFSKDSVSKTGAVAVTTPHPRRSTRKSSTATPASQVAGNEENESPNVPAVPVVDAPAASPALRKSARISLLPGMDRMKSPARGPVDPSADLMQFSPLPASPATRSSRRSSVRKN
eukprot:TRINITY_DN75861_c0_g1_i1.p1 TRINITY_DN75861_c0_g1~~TRINITY_DN75861_c0_g1_i1.p1  ORF type:complete len:176 (-),score=35.80 TRINITY_DN75861_c0_g1_i1:125-586(-)